MTPINLKSIKLFSGFTEEEFAKLAPLLHEQRYHDGRTIYAAGEPSENLYIIASGNVVVTHELDSDIITLAKLSAGYFFGEAGLLQKKHSHQSEARASSDDTVILKLDHDSFDKIKTDNPQLALHILHAIASTLSKRLGEDTTRIAIISAISDLVNEPKNLNNIEKLAQEILAITVRAIPSNSAFLGVYSKHVPEQLKILASTGLSPKHIPKELPVTSDPYLHKLFTQDGEISILSNRYESQEKVFYAKRNLLARAITIEKNNVGVILLADKVNGEFTGQNGLMLQIIAGQVSFAIEEARLRKESQAQEELKREYVGI
jgi:CRP-like cAMP-binding protein